VDLREEGDKFIVNADLPGVKKDNVEIRIGDDGRSVTIEGKFVQETPEQGASEELQAGETDSSADSRANGSPNQISIERLQSMNAAFARTIWLPLPIDAQSVKAKLEDGVLNVVAKKAVDKATTVVRVE
jgi:HSP20 family protein